MAAKRRITSNPVLWIVAALLLAVALAACGGGDEEAAAPPPAPPEEVTPPPEPAAPATTEEGGGGLLEGNPAAVTEPIVGTFDDLVDLADHPELCGDPNEKILVGMADGFGGNAWRKAQLAELETEAAKCPNIEILYTDGQGDTQKSISDIRGLIAKGADAIIMYPDAAEALLPVIKEGTEAGVAMVPVLEVVGGTPGVDYVASVHAGEELLIGFGRTYAEWLVKALNGKGNVVQLGGVPGASFPRLLNEGIKEVFAENPGMKLLVGPVDTNWDVGQCQKAMAGLLPKYDQIDGIVGDYGACVAAAIRAFQAAGRPLPAFTGDDQNVVACTWEEGRKKNPDLQAALGESRVWAVRAGLRRALAVIQRLPLDEPTIIPYALVADSVASGDLTPKCDSELSPDAFTASSQLSREEIIELFGSG